LKQKIIKPEKIGHFQDRIKQVYQVQSYQALFTAPSARILIVDDNDINRKVFRNLLKQTKIRIEDVDSGKKCLALVEKEHFDLIFLDSMMPEMDGVETLHRMKALKNNPCQDVPVIMLTANAVTGAKEQYLREGFDDFLSKPIIPEKLEPLIKSWLPAEYVQEVAAADADFTDYNAGSAAEELPRLDEFDWDYAKAHLGDGDLLKQTLLDFYRSLDREIADLAELSTQLTEAEGIANYRIRVHALKSTSAMVGALLLSKLARMLEVAAIENDIDKITVLNPILLEELQKHKKRLDGLELAAARRKGSLDSETISNLEQLKSSLKERDYDAADDPNGGA